ncbi:hypothetical protein MUN81_15475 [Hymenobacter sp. 5317J-9]|uniref:hypothetical protein n=1 Tax=Hymenobacter sp. 5317J-9 TaxID=2932250 RepID=UPI001FD66D90|nr:hypothetical protein [Hymenobacter sp. 5317J-9]UOQ96636.1 hypothetical protein MUN81_15475 [Hymenobacter sp. 5317J-9]
MNLAHLDQVIELERGEAGQLWWAVSEVGRRNLARLSRPLGARVDSAGIVVALPALARIAKRLKRIDEREQHHVGVPGRKPKKFRLKVDELVALMLHVWPESAPGHMGHVPLGKVQQKSLNLEQCIRFPGCPAGFSPR